MDSRKYLFAFIITALIFGTALFVSNYFASKKLCTIQGIEDQLSFDILASETQSQLLEETSCKDVGKATTLSRELGDLADKLSVAEAERGTDNESVILLKSQYSLLEIRDYLLMKRVTDKCGTHPTFILYFYSNAGDCADCQKMGYVLTALHDEFPDLRIYSFDYNLDLEAMHTLRAIYRLSPTLPVLVVNGDPYYGFRPLSELEKSIPALARLKTEQDRLNTLKASSTAATSTQ
jgi:hypothetical protein